MIRRVDDATGAVTLAGALPAGWSAYVDREWLGSADGPVTALLRDADGGLRWEPDGPVVATGDDGVALAVITAPVRAAASSLAGIAGEDVAVCGRGVVASEARALLGTDGAPDEPGAVVDTTADGATLAGAMSRVRTRGTVVLAGEPGDRAVALDLYPDAHGRGLRIVGVTRHAGEPVDGPVADYVAPARLAPGDHVPDGAPWVRVDAA